MTRSAVKVLDASSGLLYRVAVVGDRLRRVAGRCDDLADGLEGRNEFGLLVQGGDNG